jgi:hypothetical protein
MTKRRKDIFRFVCLKPILVARCLAQYTRAFGLMYSISSLSV